MIPSSTDPSGHPVEDQTHRVIVVSMQQVTVAATLYRYRLAAGYTQEELAERAGVSARSISDIERGISKAPHTGTLDALADALGLSTEERATLHTAAREHRSLGLREANGLRGNATAEVEQVVNQHADLREGVFRSSVSGLWSSLHIRALNRPAVVGGVVFILLAGIDLATTRSTKPPVLASRKLAFAPVALTQERPVVLGRIQAFATDRVGNLFVGTDGLNASRFMGAVDTMPARGGIWKLAPSGRVLGHWYRHDRDIVHGDDIALDRQGNIYIVDVNVNRVYKLSPRGTWLAAWGSTGTKAGQFIRAGAITTDMRGRVFVGDSTGRIQIFSPTGSLLKVWSNCGVHQSAYCLPVDMATDLHDNLYVSEGAVKSGVRKLSPGGTVLDEWTSTGETPSQPVFAPGAVSTDMRNHVVMSDEYSGGVFKYVSHGKAVLWFRVAPHDYGYPLALAIDPKGDAYVTDCCVNTIRRFAAAGIPAGILAPFETVSVPLFNPSGIAIDQHGRVVAVTANTNATVITFSTSGRVAASWREDVLGRGQAHAAVGVTVDANGNTYVVDAVTSRIVELSRSGAFVHVWGSEGSGPGKLDNPSGIALDRRRNLLVTDTGNNRVVKFAPSGKAFRHWGESASLVRPRGVAVDADGNVYVADSGSHAVKKLSAKGRLLTQWVGTGSESLVAPAGVAVDGLGHVFVTDTGDGRIKEFSSRGDPIAVWGSRGARPGEFVQPGAITVDRSGGVWVADTGNNRVQRLVVR